MKGIFSESLRLQNILWFLSVTAGVSLSGLFARKVIFRQLLKWASRTESKLDDILLEALARPFLFWMMLLGLYLGKSNLLFTPGFEMYCNKALLILFVGSLTMLAGRILGGVIRQYEARFSRQMQITSLSQNVINLVLFTVAFLIILNILGVSVAPIATAFGVGGLAIGLALQDTLSNLFSGIYIILAKQVNVGDYIRLNTGEEGVVDDISWRTTAIKTLQNNIVIVPNLKISQAILTNFTGKDSETAVLVQMCVAYDSDLATVEKAALYAGTEVQKTVPGGVAFFTPVVRFNAFEESGIGVAVALRAVQFTDQFLLKHEFIKLIVKRFSEAGIRMPYPTRTVIMKEKS